MLFILYIIVLYNRLIIYNFAIIDYFILMSYIQGSAQSIDCKINLLYAMKEKFDIYDHNCKNKENNFPFGMYELLQVYAYLYIK